MSLAWESMCIRVLSLAHCSSSWCWRHFHVSSARVCHGSFSTLMTWSSSDTQEEFISELKAWKAGMESKGTYVKMKKNKFLVFGDGHYVLMKSGKYPRAACSSGVGSNSIHYSQYMQRVHNQRSGITKRLAADSSYVCHRCKGEARPINGRAVTEVDVDGTMLDVEATFCYLKDNLCSGDSAIAGRCCVAWGKLRKLLPVLTTRYLSPRICARV